MPNERLVRQALLAKPTGKRPRRCARPRWSNCISDLAWPLLGVEPAELSEIASDHEVLQVDVVPTTSLVFKSVQVASE